MTSSDSRKRTRESAARQAASWRRVRRIAAARLTALLDAGSGLGLGSAVAASAKAQTQHRLRRQTQRNPLGAAPAPTADESSGKDRGKLHGSAIDRVRLPGQHDRRKPEQLRHV